MSLGEKEIIIKYLSFGAVRLWREKATNISTYLTIFSFDSWALGIQVPTRENY